MIWKAIKGYENYFVSNTGDIKNKNGALLKQTISSKKRYVSLFKDGVIQSHIPVHKLVAQAFLPSGKGIIAFKNGDTTDCNLKNLFYSSEYTKNDIEYYKDNATLSSHFKAKCERKGWKVDEFFRIVAGINKHKQKVYYYIHKNLLFIDKI